MRLWRHSSILPTRKKFLELEWLLEVRYDNDTLFAICRYSNIRITVPYHCTSLGLVGAYLCMGTPGLTNVNTLIAQANAYAANNLIDPTSNIQGDRVFIFQSSADTVVLPGL